MQYEINKKNNKLVIYRKYLITDKMKCNRWIFGISLNKNKYILIKNINKII